MSVVAQDRGLSLNIEQEERAARLHSEAVVIDCSSVVKQEPAHFERARSGGVTATNHTVTHPASDLARALREIDACRRWIEANPNDAILATSVADIERAKESGREAIIFGPQNTEFIGLDLAHLGTAYDLGVRILQLTYQRQNWVGAGCGERVDGGLSTYGREFVRAMNQLGIVVDVSHCGQQTGLDAMDVSSTPVIVSHGHPSAVAPHARAKDDDFLRALAAQGGVIGLTAISMFLYDPADPHVRPGLADLARHFEHVINLVGVEHVGIGLDFDETNTPQKYAADAAAHPEIYTQSAAFGWDDKRIHGLTHAGEELSVTRTLVSLGLADEEIRSVLGGNFMRVFRTAWRT